MKKMFGILLLGILLLVFAFFFFFRSPHYKINTTYSEGLFIIKNLTKTNTATNSNGICAPPGCGYSNNIEKETTNLELSGEQLTSLVNQYKSSQIPLSGIKISIKDQIIYVSADSLYKVIPGNISSSAKLNLNHFYVQDVYIGNIKAPKNVANFVEANFDKLLKDSLSDLEIRINKMEIIDNKIFVSVFAPKGMITIGQDGIIQIDLGKKPLRNLPQENKDNQY